MIETILKLRKATRIIFLYGSSLLVLLAAGGCNESGMEPGKLSSHKILFQGKKTTDEPWLTYEFNPTRDTFRKASKSFASTRSASYSPDGTLILINGKMDLSEPARLYLVNRSGEEVEVIDNTNEVQFPAWSHGGDFISYHQRRYFVRELTSGVVDEVGPGIMYDPEPQAWSPSANSLVFSGFSANGNASFLYEYDVVTKISDRISDAFSHGSDMIYTPDGAYVTFVHTFQYRWQVLRLAIGETTPDTLLGRGGISTELLNPIYSPDGKWMAFTFGAEYSDLWLQDVATRETRQIGDVTGSVIHAAWRPDGEGVGFVVKEFLSKTPYLYYYSLRDDTVTKLMSSYQCSSFSWSPESEN